MINMAEVGHFQEIFEDKTNLKFWIFMGMVMNQNNGHLNEPQPISIISWDNTKMFLFVFLARILKWC